MRNYLKAVVTFIFLMAAVSFMPSTADAAIAAPTGLRQTDCSTSGVGLTWNATTDADYYYLSWSSDQVNWSTPSTYDRSSNPTDTITSLNAGSTYYVRVRSFSNGKIYLSDADDEYSDWSAPIEVVTSPNANTMTDAVKTDATSSSLTIQWSACAGATSYNVYNYDTQALIGTTTTPSITVSGLAAASKLDIKIYPVRTSSTGYVAAKTYAYKFGFYTKPNTPATPSTANFGLSNVYYNISTAYFGVNDKSGTASGFELCAYTVKGGKLAFTTTSSYTSFKAKKNVAYKYRMRYYTEYDGQKIYGGWSPYRYFSFPSISGKKYSSKIKMGWKKNTAVSSYVVSISTSRNGGYKKVKTLGSKSSGITIYKCGKKRISRSKSYYVKIATKFKNGKKSVKNDITYLGSSL